MVAALTAADRVIRPLDTGDAERVIAIDRARSGHSRRHFFEKRFAAAKAQPDDFIQIGIVQDGLLRGFAIARVHRGEFGLERTVAVLDAIGVESESRERGIGQLLMRELGKVMGSRGVRALQSQADWTNHELLRFFAAAGFKLAPRLALERPVAVPLDEATEEI
jgi:ribosomal protein S18 acetylase RimI-like enzyme